jgi:hypothetical protein
MITTKLEVWEKIWYTPLGYTTTYLLYLNGKYIAEYYDKKSICKKIMETGVFS